MLITDFNDYLGGGIPLRPPAPLYATLQVPGFTDKKFSVSPSVSIEWGGGLSG